MSGEFARRHGGHCEDDSWRSRNHLPGDWIIAWADLRRDRIRRGFKIAVHVFIWIVGLTAIGWIVIRGSK